MARAVALFSLFTPHTSPSTALQRLQKQWISVSFLQCLIPQGHLLPWVPSLTLCFSRTDTGWRKNPNLCLFSSLPTSDATCSRRELQQLKPPYFVCLVFCHYNCGMNAKEKKELTVIEFAQEAGVSMPTVYTWVMLGRVKCLRQNVGGFRSRIKIPSSELDRIPGSRKNRKRKEEVAPSP